MRKKNICWLKISAFLFSESKERIRCFDSYETSIEILSRNICQNWFFPTDSLFWLISLFPEKNIWSNISHPSLVLVCVAVPASHHRESDRVHLVAFFLLRILYPRLFWKYIRKVLFDQTPTPPPTPIFLSALSSSLVSFFFISPLLSVVADFHLIPSLHDQVTPSLHNQDLLLFVCQLCKRNWTFLFPRFWAFASDIVLGTDDSAVLLVCLFPPK